MVLAVPVTGVEGLHGVVETAMVLMKVSTALALLWLTALQHQSHPSDVWHLWQAGRAAEEHQWILAPRRGNRYPPG